MPVVVKEVGWGLSRRCGPALLAAGVAAVDVAGAGGTSWSEVERLRGDDAQSRRGRGIRRLGYPHRRSARGGARSGAELPIIASGGIRDGVEVAKCVALGADLVGLASPLLKAAARSAEDAERALEILGAAIAHRHVLYRRARPAGAAPYHDLQRVEGGRQ